MKMFNIIVLNFANTTIWTYSITSCSTLWISRYDHIFNVIVLNFTNIMAWTYSMSLYSNLQISRHEHSIVCLILWISRHGHIQCHCTQLYEYHNMGIFNVIVLNFTNTTTWTCLLSLCSTLWISQHGHI